MGIKAQRKIKLSGRLSRLNYLIIHSSLVEFSETEKYLYEFAGNPEGLYGLYTVAVLCLVDSCKLSTSSEPHIYQ